MTMTETVQLWIDNDQRLYNDVLDAVRDSGAEGDESGKAGDAVKDVVEGFLPPLDGLAADLVQHALWDVDWTDLGGDYLGVLADEDGA